MKIAKIVSSFLNENFTKATRTQCTVKVYVLRWHHLINHKEYIVQHFELNYMWINWWSRGKDTGLSSRRPGFKSLHGLSIFFHFCPFFQTLRAFSPFQRTLANKNTLPCCSTRFRELLELSLVHVLSRALCVNLVWKIAIIRFKNDHFLPFSYS